MIEEIRKAETTWRPAGSAGWLRDMERRTGRPPNCYSVKSDTVQKVLINQQITRDDCPITPIVVQPHPVYFVGGNVG